jgi:predicted flap endonuclease-1-like 5' DNA nuclease
MWKYFILGLLVGWLVEWIIDWLFWRRTPPPARLARPAEGHGDAAHEAARRPADGGARMAASAAPASDAPPESQAPGRPAIEPNERTTTSADTAAGRVGGAVAVGAGGAVSTSSATLTTEAAVYRQEDLEAIAGVGPKVGAMLRNNGITTFAELAATPLPELVRIVESTGESPDPLRLASWSEQAKLAALQDWDGLAALQRSQGEPTRGEGY